MCWLGKTQEKEGADQIVGNNVPSPGVTWPTCSRAILPHWCLSQGRLSLHPGFFLAPGLSLSPLS